MLCTRCLRSSAALPRTLPLLARRTLSASASPLRTPEAQQQQQQQQQLSTPVTAPGEQAKPAAAPKSICPEGTVLKGLNYFKSQQDPVALKDEEYPAWLWDCLEVQKKSSDDAADEAGDEFSKSKKQRKLAAKRQKELEAKLLAEGNLEALAPKVPLQHQSINLPGEENGSVEHNIQAAEARDALRKAMRKERKAKIKESNYLKSM